MPVAGSVLPEFTDLDETLVLRLGPDGSIRGLVDDLLLKVRGSGDFVVRTPGTATGVANRGGDSPPRLDRGHVVFEGHVEGSKQLAAEATLEPAITRSLPVSARLSVTSGRAPVDLAQAAGTAGTFAHQVDLANRTGREASLDSGTPDGPAGLQALATAESALRNAATVYTPETNLASLFPLPASIPVTDARQAAVRLQVPLEAVVTVRVPAGDDLEAPGASVVRDGQGTQLRWTVPFAAGSPESAQVRWTVTTRSFRPGGVGVVFSVRPRAPAAASDPAARLLAVQVAAAEFARVAELSPPLGRPGSGPQQVRYDFRFESPPSAAPAAARRSSPKPVPIALTLLGLLALAGGGAWVWSRN